MNTDWPSKPSQTKIDNAILCWCNIRDWEFYYNWVLIDLSESLDTIKAIVYHICKLTEKQWEKNIKQKFRDLLNI